MSEPSPAENSAREEKRTRLPWHVREADAMADEVRRLHKMEARGDLAALRRIELKRPHEPALLRLLIRAGIEPRVMSSGERLEPYALAALTMALRPDALSPGRLGQALHAAGFSEKRLSALLNARSATLFDLIRRTARRLASDSEGEGLPYRELCALALLDGVEAFEREAENLRVRIASDYQRAEDGERRTGNGENGDAAATGNA